MLLRLYNILIHMSAWLAFFLFSVMLAPKPEDRTLMPQPPFPTFFLTLFPMLVGFYYLNNKILISRLLSRQWRQIYVMVIIGFGGMIIYFASIRPFGLNSGTHIPQAVKEINLILSILLFLIIFIASSGDKIVRFWFAAEERKKVIEFESTASELLFLKSQINPHFLFNTLNNIYTLTILKSEKAAEAVLKLADMMRYVLSETGSRPVDIQKELDYLNQYVALQIIRLTDRVEVDFKVFGKDEGQMLAPLILIPFVENAFKYGVSTKEKSVIRIHVFLKPHELTLQTENRLFEGMVPKNQSTGVGLKNVKRRLELLYEDRHWLRIETIKENFYVDLTLTL